MFLDETMDIPITTGLTLEGRSQVLIHTADAFIVVGGGSGTLDEICVAYLYRKPIVALHGGGGWADRLPEMLIEGRYLDHRRLVPIQFATEPETAVALALDLARVAGESGAGASGAAGGQLGDVPNLPGTKA